MTLEQRHAEAAKRSLGVVMALYYLLGAEYQRIPNDAQCSAKDHKLAKKLLAELLPKTYVLPKRPRKKRGS